MLTALVAGFLWAFSSPAIAVSHCRPFDQVDTMLKDKYGERVLAKMLATNGYAVIYGNPETQTWSILMVFEHPTLGEIACVNASGTGYGMTFPDGPSPIGMAS